MRWDCRSCELSDNQTQKENYQKPLSCFGVRNASDFVQRLLPQGKWTRCSECSIERKGQLGGQLGGTVEAVRRVARHGPLAGRHQ